MSKWIALWAGACLMACVSPVDRERPAVVADSMPAEGVVDSVIPIAEALERFRADLPRPAGLGSGAAERDELVRRLVEVLAANDTMALEPLVVSRPEYAWLYYPSAPVARPPYELPPALAWFQLQQGNRIAALRLLREFGGQAIELRRHRCAEAPIMEGENRLWTRCRVRLALPDGTERELRLFSSILERDGRFAFLSLTNDF